ncbi:uncharacterized protein LOC144107272 [Amblyomma americanum]
MSATINVEKFSEYFNGAPIIRIPGKIHPLNQYFLEDHVADNLVPQVHCKRTDKSWSIQHGLLQNLRTAGQQHIHLIGGSSNILHKFCGRDNSVADFNDFKQCTVLVLKLENAGPFDEARTEICWTSSKPSCWLGIQPEGTARSRSTSASQPFRSLGEADALFPSCWPQVAQ